MRDNTFIAETVEYLSVKRQEKLNNAIFGEIKEIIKDNEIHTTIELNEQAIVEALKKQIPTRVNKHKYTIFCPNCHECLEIPELLKYCYQCGQALDWWETEKGGIEE